MVGTTITKNHTFIKRVHIQGFKSYKDQTKQIEPFSNHCNIIVGRNGTGKSNFFYAIRFVLSDVLNNTQAQQRQELLHESPGSTTMSAYVEIVFDNRDGRFPVEKEEVVLRRTIGLKKDEYYLDRKHVSKSDVTNMLESAGFSKSNPYYIVQQGKVSALTIMKDSERLELLKEVAGTRVYDERKDESVKIMKDTDGKIAKIQEMLDYIKERLEELEGEKNELKQYQELDKQKRLIEYTIYDTEKREASKKLEELDREKEAEAAQAAVYHQAAALAHEEMRRIEKELKSLNVELQRKLKDKELLEDEKSELIKSKVATDINLEETRRKAGVQNEERDRLQQALTNIEKTIKDKTATLEKLTKKYESTVAKEQEAKQKIGSNERRLTELYSKQGRAKQYKTKKERDAALKEDIKKLEADAKDTAKRFKEVESDIADGRSNVEKLKQQVATGTGQQSSIKEQITKLQKALGDCKDRRDKAANARKEAWKADNDLDIKQKDIRAEVQKAEHHLQSIMPKAVSAGVARIRELEGRYKGKVYGQLIDLFQCSEAAMTAVEVAAGASLMNFVVDTVDTAAQILQLMESQKGRPARVTFLPLDKIVVKEKSFRDVNEQDAHPLIKELTFDPHLKKAFLHVFGKTLLCRNLDVATIYARDHGFNCITLEGDQRNRKGVLTGGFFDRRFAKLPASKAAREWRERGEDLKDEAKKVKTQLEEADRDVTTILGELQTLETKLGSAESNYQRLTYDLNVYTTEIQNQNQDLDQQEKIRAGLVLSQKTIADTIQGLQQELTTELQSKLTDAEADELRKLNTEQDKLQELVLDAARNRTEAEVEKNRIVSEINNVLTKQKAETLDKLQNTTVNDESVVLTQLRRDTEKCEQALKENKDKLQALQASVDEIKEKETKLKGAVDEQRTLDNTNTRSYDDQTKKMEKILDKRSVLIQKREENARKIRELGSLPSDTTGSLHDLTIKELIEKLREVNSELKKYNNVNKKALDQYVSFSNQQQELGDRKKELDDGAKSISELIDTLDKKKDEAIDRTFKGVAKNFREIFTELVPTGSASLVMLREESSSASQDGSQPRGLAYTGISIRASFGDKSENQIMQQLSGGQKSLVALALIFAIQRADPAPFYLFDELVFDTRFSARGAVAQLIKKLSENTQFIISTFKPELVTIADKFYGIRFANSVSRVVNITKAEALNLVASGEKVPEGMEEDEETGDGEADGEAEGEEGDEAEPMEEDEVEEAD